MPMDSTNPEFMEVARIPEAAPRSSAGTLFIMVVVLGAENIPTPSRSTRMSTSERTDRGSSPGSTSKSDER